MASRTGGKQLVLCLFLIVFVFGAGIPAAVAQQSQELPALELQVQVSEGDAEVKGDGDNTWKKLDQGDTLAEGDRVRTGEEGSVQLEAPGVALTELESGGSIQVKRLDRQGDAPGKTINHIRIRALKGKVMNSIRDHEGVETRYRLSSENGVAGLRGTNFLYEIGPGGSVATSVLDGEVFFFHPDRPAGGVSVTAGERRRIREGLVRPDDPEPIDPSSRRRLRQFRGEADRKLRLKPDVESLQLGDTGVEERVLLRYEQPRNLTLSGVARALEPGAAVQRLTVEGDFVESILRFDGARREQPWQLSGEPTAVEEGSRRRLQIRLRATDSLGTPSDTRVIELILTNPEDGDEPVSDTEAVLERLESMRRSLIRKDVQGYTEGLSDDADIRLEEGIVNRNQLEDALTEVLPLLEEFTWDYEVTRMRRDPSDTDLLRVNLESLYEADFVRPIGISPGASSGGAGSLDVRTRTTRTLRSRALEEYVFHFDGSGSPRITSMSSGLFLGSEIRRQSRRIRGRWAVKNALFGLFYNYENKRSGPFENLVHPRFLNLDDNGFRHDKEDFLDSVRADLDHLNNLDHRVRVDSLQFVGPDEVEVEITWSRRARLGNTNQLWLLQRQRTVLRFRSGSSFLLYRVQGDPLFGLSSARTRTTLVRGGTIEGEENDSTEMIGDDLELTSADPTEFPELDPEDAEELEEEAESSGGSCVSGTVSSDVASDQTWCEEIQLQNTITVQSGATLTVQDNTTVNIPGGESLQISGTMEAINVTFPGPGQSNQGSGLILKDGADVTIRNSSFSPSNNANAAITIEDGADVTLVSEGNEYEATAPQVDFGVRSEASAGTLRFDGDTFEGFNSCGIQQGGACLDTSGDTDPAPPDITINNCQFNNIGQGSGNGG